MNKLDYCYMRMAYTMAELSKATRLKVGALLVLDSGVCVPTVNGLPKQLGNECERFVDGILTTKPEVIHAEEQVLNKCALEGLSTRGGILYCTHSPCAHCSSRIIASGIKEVVFSEYYRNSDGIDNLKLASIIVRQFEMPH